MRRYTASIDVPDSFLEPGVSIEAEISCLKDGILPIEELITLANTYPQDVKVEYSIIEIKE